MPRQETPIVKGIKRNVLVVAYVFFDKGYFIILPGHSITRMHLAAQIQNQKLKIWHITVALKDQSEDHTPLTMLDKNTSRCVRQPCRHLHKQAVVLHTL
jgi:hypothetical protein